MSIPEEGIAQRFVAVGSLVEGTCSDRAVRHVLKQNARRWVQHEEPSFSALVEWAAVTSKRVLYLPEIHTLCRELASDSRWKLHADLSFELSNPPLYLAARSDMRSVLRDCATIAPLIPYATQAAQGAEREITRFIAVNNTQVAAQECAVGRYASCVTNATGLNRYGLRSLARLAEINMKWVAFSRRNKEQECV